MNKRRQYIVDKKFQLKTTFAFIGIVSLLTAFIIIAIALTVAYNNNKLRGIIQSEDQIFQALVVISSRQVKDASYKASIGNMVKDHVNNIQTSDRITGNNRILLIALLVFIVLQGIILYVMLIIKTHRISGPIYVMSNYFREIINGKLPRPRALRKNDELADFYGLFTQMVDSLGKNAKGGVKKK